MSFSQLTKLPVSKPRPTYAQPSTGFSHNYFSGRQDSDAPQMANGFNQAMFDNALRNFGSSFQHDVNTGFTNTLDNKLDELNLGGISSRLSQVDNRLANIDARVGDTLTRGDLNSTTSNIQNLSGQVNAMADSVENNAALTQNSITDVLSSLGSVNANVGAIQTGQNQQSRDLSDQISRINLNLNPAIAANTAALSRIPDQITREINPALATNTAALNRIPDQITREINPVLATNAAALNRIPDQITREINPALATNTAALSRIPDQITSEINPAIAANTATLDRIPDQIEGRVSGALEPALASLATNTAAVGRLPDQITSGIRNELNPAIAANTAAIQHIPDQIKGNLTTVIEDAGDNTAAAATEAINRRLDAEDLARNFRATQQLITGSEATLQDRVAQAEANYLGRADTLQDHLAQNRDSLDAFRAATGAGFQHLGDSLSNSITSSGAATQAALRGLEGTTSSGLQSLGGDIAASGADTQAGIQELNAATTAGLAGLGGNLSSLGDATQADLQNLLNITGTGFSGIGSDIAGIGYDVAGIGSDVASANNTTQTGIQSLADQTREGFNRSYDFLGDFQGSMAQFAQDAADHREALAAAAAARATQNTPPASTTSVAPNSGTPAASSLPTNAAENAANTTNLDYAGYVDANGLTAQFDNMHQRVTDYLISKGWDLDGDGQISKPEYGQFHWDFTSSLPNGGISNILPPATLAPTPDPTATPDPDPVTTPAPDPVPAGPTPEELITQAIQSQYGNLFNQGGLLYDASGERDIYDMVRAADARAASNPFDINEIYSSRNRAEEELRALDAFQRELGNTYTADQLAGRTGDIDAMRSNLQSVLDQANARISEYGAEGGRLDTEAANIAAEAQDLLRQMQGSTNVRDLYGPNGAEALRQRFNSLMARAQNPNSYAADGSRFSGVLGLQSDFNAAYDNLIGRRNASLSDLGSELDAISSGFGELRDFDAQGLADLEARLNAVRGDVSAFGAQGTADLANRVDELRGQFGGFADALTGRRREFEDQAMAMARDAIGNQYATPADLQAAQDQLDLMRLNASQYGAAGAMDDLSFLQSRLDRERQRLASEAQVVAEREAAARASREAELAAQRAPEPATSSFNGIRLPDSAAYENMTPQQYLQLLAQMNAQRGTTFQDAGARAPGAFSTALAALNGG